MNTMSGEYPHPSNAAVSAVMRGNKSKDTSPELRIRSFLHRRGHRYRVHLSIPLKSGGQVRPDIVFTRQRVAVFVDGCFWHRCPHHGNVPRSNGGYWTQKLKRNQVRDAYVSAELRTAGWTVVRIWEHEELGRAVNQIEDVLRVQPAGLSGIGHEL